MVAIPFRNRSRAERKPRIKYGRFLAIDVDRIYWGQMPQEDLIAHLDRRSYYRDDSLMFPMIGAAVAGFIVGFIAFAFWNMGGGLEVQDAVMYASPFLLLGAGIGFLFGRLAVPKPFWIIQRGLREGSADSLVITSWLHPRFTDSEWTFQNEDGEQCEPDEPGAEAVPQVYRATSLHSDLEGTDYKNELKGGDASWQQKVELGLIAGTLIVMAILLILFTQANSGA